MLKRIKETLTCSDSSGGIRAKLKSHHLLHSDKSTYTYFYNKSKVRVSSLGKHILYSPSIPLLGGAALLLVLGLSVGCIGDASGISNSIAYAEGTPAEECNAGNAVLSLDMSGDMNLSTSVDNDISNGNISYLSKDFTVTACRTAGYKVYVQANSSKLQNQQAPDALFGVGENKSVTDFTDNTWGYAVDEATKDNIAMLYNTMLEPSTSRTESYSENVSTGAAGKNLKITFAAKFGKDKVAGHYTSDVLMSVVPGAENVTIYTLTYDGNGNTGGTPPATQIADGGGTYDFTVLNRGDILKTNFGFLGWAETPGATVATYQPDSIITLTADSPNKTLYAVWSSTSLKDITNMQQMTSPICEATSVGDTKTLTDSRDSTDYTVKKLSDDNCWMTKNLDLNLQAGKELTPADSDVKSNWDPEQTTIAEGNLSEGAWPMPSSPSVDQANIIRSYDSGNTTYGNYYSWVAATAGSGTSTSRDEDAPSSICPKGWRLPTGGSGGEFAALVNKGKSSWDGINKGCWFGGTSSTDPGAAFFHGGGRVKDSKLGGAGEIGNYWSSLNFTATYGGQLEFYSSFVYTGSANIRYLGYSVRCVAK